MAESSKNGLVKVTVNGVELETPPGRMLIDVAEEAGVFVPRFCYHPGLESVAACRMCLVQIEGSKRPLEPACATPVSDGMVVLTDSEPATEAQKAVLEMLLINHPLDCPICDRGGECPLQDQTLAFGPGNSRYIDEKRHFKKPLPISNLVMLDRERCVLCWRCTRFSAEVAGDEFIDLMDRGSHTQINVAPGNPFDSYFSGNTIQICPVGALTSASYRFLSRPWDLQDSPSTCSYCAVGCPISLEHRDGQLLRTQALPNENVNSFWSCDKGRFGHRYVSHPERLRAPMMRGPGGLRETSWDAALDELASRLKSVLRHNGPSSVGLIGGSHTTNEDLFAAGRVFREVLGSRNLDFRVADAAFPYERCVVNGILGSDARIDDLDAADVIVWVGPDPKEELPVLYLRIRKAVAGGADLVVVHPRRISLSQIGTHVAAGPDGVAQAVRELADAKAGSAKRLVVCVGQQFVGRSMHEAVDESLKLVGSVAGAKLLLCVPNNNSQGAIDMGIWPHADAGHRQSSGDGMSTAQMLKAAAEGRFRLLWILGADLASDFPDAALVQKALASDTFVIVSDLFPTRTAMAADLVLPAQSFAEKDGSFTNLERRLQRVSKTLGPSGVSRPDWRIFHDVAVRMGAPSRWTSAEDVAAAIAAEVPTHSSYSWDSLGTAPPAAPAVMEGAWPLSWELRAVDAKRRTGHVWEGTGTLTPRVSVPPPPADETSAAYPLSLLVARTLYDGGAMVSRAPELRNVTLDPFVELHPVDADERSLQAGDVVVVQSKYGAVSLPLRVSDATPPGSAFMLHDQGRVQANLLLSADDPYPRVEVRP